MFLYALNFPNDNLLADECSSGGTYPTPNPATDPYWCTPDGCTQAPLQPANAIGGPYATSTACATACAAIIPPNPPYWCVDSACVQSSTPPDGYTGGPYASLDLCQSSSCESPVYYSINPALMLGANNIQQANQKQSIPEVESGTDANAQSETPSGLVRRITDTQMTKIKLPCVHRGGRIDNGFTCSRAHYACGLHGTCSLIDSTSGSRACIDCEDYSPRNA